MGWQPDIWRTFGDELGILGATLPEAVGGLGGGSVEVMVIAEALGYALVVEPYVDTVVVAGGLLRRAGTARADAARGDRRRPRHCFQVLQHRMVDMYMELGQAVAGAYLAVPNLEAEPASRARAVSAGKATVGRAARFIGQNAVQLHGGMGMTEELAIVHYFKRLTAIQREFGWTDQHVARYARLTCNSAGMLRR